MNQIAVTNSCVESMTHGRENTNTVFGTHAHYFSLVLPEIAPIGLRGQKTSDSSRMPMKGEEKRESENALAYTLLIRFSEGTFLPLFRHRKSGEKLVFWSIVISGPDMYQKMFV